MKASQESNPGGGWHLLAEHRAPVAGDALEVDAVVGDLEVLDRRHGHNLRAADRGGHSIREHPPTRDVLDAVATLEAGDEADVGVQRWDLREEGLQVDLGGDRFLQAGGGCGR